MILFFTAQEKKMKPIKIGVIGTGYFGSIHANILSRIDNAVLSGVCDIDVKKVRQCAKRLGVEAFTDYRDLIGTVDAVSIVAPTIHHYAIARDFLKARVPVLIEKPISSTLDEADKLLELAEQNKTIIQVGHVERFNSAVKAVQNSLKEPKFIECHRLGPYKKRGTDIGIVLDLMIHDLDIILGLIRYPITSIDAVGINVLSEAVEDIANVRLRFANGAVCNITASRISLKSQRKIRIFQEDAYISIDYEKQRAEIYTKADKKIKRQAVNIKRENPLKAELEDFLRCVRTHDKPLVSGIEAREALKSALYITETIKNENKKWLQKK